MIRTMVQSDCALLQPLCSEISGGLRLEHELGRAITRAWVGLDAGESYGFCVTWVVLDEAEIAAMGTLPTFRRRGLGQQLLAHTLEQLRDRGVVRTTLEVASHNTAAIGLYQSIGFRRFRVRRGYYRVPDSPTRVDAWEMEIDLLALPAPTQNLRCR